jgi:hypothetical protein
LPILAVIASRLLRVNYPLSFALFWGVPSLILTFWARDKAVKVALFSAVGTILLMGLDIIFWANKQWVVVSAVQNSKFLGLVAWEDIPYWFLYVYFPVIFWEHFFERKTSEPVWSKRMSEFSEVVLIALLAIIGAWIWLPKLITIPYFYLVATIIFVITPLALELRDHPQLGVRFLRVGVYFAYVAILYELTALSLGLWYYPSNQFIGWVDIRGLRFPIEELIAWILFGAAAILSCYEYLDDYRRGR